jgi:hypothetical protein
MRILWIADVILLLVLNGCSTVSGPKVEIGGYSFLFDGREYRIESVTPNYSEGYNILSLRDGDRLLLKGIDKEQDGKLDELVAGSIPLEEANAIYCEGIREGDERGYLKKRTFAREYKTTDPIYSYVLATYVLALGEIYNKLTISNKQIFQETAILVDQEADGQLDRIDHGLDSIQHYQKLYQEVLNRGMKENKIVRSGKRFLVVI